MMGLGPSRATAALQVLAFSGLWVGAVAAGLVLACGLAVAPGLGALERSAGMALAFAGALVVYNVDRLRDLERDRETAPMRSRFVEQHRTGVVALTGGAALACPPLAWPLPPPVWGLCAAVLAFGLLHRRLKDRARFKIVYVTLAWLSVAVGLPGLSAGWASLDLPAAVRVAAVCAPAIAANLIASDLRNAVGPSDPAGRLRAARLLAAAGTALPPLLATPVWPLAAIAAAELASLCVFRHDEHYGHVAVDGALLAGSLLAALLLTALG